MKARARARFRPVVAIGLLFFAATTAGAQLRIGQSTDSLDSLDSAVLSTAADPINLLLETPGGFTYDLSIPGWPSGFAYRGLTPNDLGLTTDDHSWNDVFTGRPRFDLVPVQLLHAPQLSASTHAAGYRAAFAQRSFSDSQPLTEATYWSSNTGLQSVRIVHAQQRSWSRAPERTARPNSVDSTSIPLPDPADSTSTAMPVESTQPVSPIEPGVPQKTVATVQFTYGGGTATGEFPGSKVERARQVGLRMMVQGRRWSVGVNELFNRRSVGAHGGVNPPIFQRLGATVFQPTAVRETRRNDLSMFGMFELLEFSPLNASVAWTDATERYTTSSDTVEARTTRVSWNVTQPLPGVPLAATARGSVDRVKDTRGMTVDPERNLNAGASSLFAGVRARHTSSRLSATAELGGTRISSHDASHIGVAGAANATISAGILRGHIEASSTLRSPRLIDEVGFDAYLVPAARLRSSRITTGAAGMTATWRTVVVGATGFATVSTRPIDYQTTEVRDSVAVVQFDQSFTVLGASVTGAWRSQTTRGLYLTVRGDVYQPQELSGEARILADALPSAYAHAQLGFRQTLFQGDLIADVAIRGRAWPEMTGRTLHPQTGLLVATTGAVSIPASGVVDLVVSARIRTATIWILYENALSGTTVIEGNQLVDGYPLEQQRIRFGLHWPLKG